MNVLIVDDIVVNRYILRELVKKMGHSFFEADNGKTAIEILEKEEIGIILLDLEMPVMNGFETAKYIRHNLFAPKSNVKIIALTAFNLSLLHEEYNTSDFDSIITKPYSVDKIKSIIDSVIQ